jgi:predicted nucleic acid-binding protein
MKVLVDTCVWSQVIRHKRPDLGLTEKLNELIYDGRVAMIGPIRQELLSGVSRIGQFNKLRKHLTPFADIPLTTEYFEKAAEFCNICRQKGVQGSTTDFLICATAYLEKLCIFTTDMNFEKYQKYLPIKLLVL